MKYEIKEGVLFYAEDGKTAIATWELSPVPHPGDILIAGANEYAIVRRTKERLGDFDAAYIVRKLVMQDDDKQLRFSFTDG